MPTPRIRKKKTVGARKKQRAEPEQRARRTPVTAPTVSGVAPGMQAVSPFLAVANVRASMHFLERTLGFVPTVALPDADGQLRYAEMRKGDTIVMLVRKGDQTGPSGGAAALYTYVDDVDAALARARDGGAGCGSAEDMAWGDRTATITDPDGHRWVVATFKKLVPFVVPAPD